MIILTGCFLSYKEHTQWDAWGNFSCAITIHLRSTFSAPLPATGCDAIHKRSWNMGAIMHCKSGASAYWCKGRKIVCWFRDVVSTSGWGRATVIYNFKFLFTLAQETEPNKTQTLGLLDRMPGLQGVCACWVSEGHLHSMMLKSQKNNKLFRQVGYHFVVSGQDWWWGGGCRRSIPTSSADFLSHCGGLSTVKSAKLHVSTDITVI